MQLCPSRRLVLERKQQSAVPCRHAICMHRSVPVEHALFQQPRQRHHSADGKLQWRSPSRAVVVGCFSGEEGSNTVELEIKIEGMVCDGCSSRVQDVLQKLPNVQKASVNLETKLASIEVTAGSQLDALSVLPSLVEEIQGLGFEAEPHFA